MKAMASLELDPKCNPEVFGVILQTRYAIQCIEHKEKETKDSDSRAIFVLHEFVLCNKFRLKKREGRIAR